MAAFDSGIEPTQSLSSLSDSAGACAAALNVVYAALTRRLEPTLLLDAALDEILRVTGFSVGGIATWDEAAQTFRLFVQRGWSQELVQRFEQPCSTGGLHWLAADSDQPLFWQASLPLPNEPATLLRQIGYSTGVFLPLSAPEERVGMLVLLSKAECALGSDEREFLFHVSQLLSVAMRNASLFAEMSRLRKFNERIVQSMDEGIALEDVQGRFTFVNQRFVEVTGYTLQEAIGMHWSRLIAPEEVEHVRAESAQRPDGAGGRYETLLLTKDGRLLPALISATPLFEEGHYIGTLSVFSDIYPLKRAEERLRALNAASVAVQKVHSPDQVFLTVARELGKLGLGMVAYLLDPDGQMLQLSHNSLNYKSFTAPVLMPATCRLESVPLFKRVLQTHLPALVLAGEDANASELGNLAIDERLGKLGLICAPIVQLERAIGVLIVGGSSDVTENDLPAVSGFANHIAVALENAALHRSLERQVERLAALHQVSLEVASQLDQEALLQTICEHAVRMLDVNGAGLWMLSLREGMLELIAGYNPAAQFIGTRLKRGEGIAGRVVDTGRALVVEDYSRWEGRSPQYPVSKFLGVLGVPLVWGGQVMGVLVASDTRQRRAFSSDDVRLLTLFAQQAAVGILNARAYQAEQNRRRLAEILREAAMILGAHLVLSDVLDLVLEQLGRLISYTSASIALVDDQGWLRLSAARGFENVSKVIDLTAWPLADDSKAQVMLETRQPMIIDDTRQDARWFDVPGVNVRAWIGAPLILGERVIGILNVDHAQPGFYRPEDAEMAAIFAGQIVTAIENARLYAEAQRRIKELRGLNQVARAFSMMRDLSETARVVTEQVAQVLRAEKCWILLLSPDQREAIGLSPAFGLNEKELARLRLETNSDLYVALLQNEHCLIGDLAELSPAVRAMFHSIGIRTLAGAMMRVHGQELGVLLAANRTDAVCKPCGFTQDDAAWLAAVSTQAAIALDNARLYKDTIHLKAHYQNVIDSIGAVIYTVDRELSLTSFNAEWDRQVAWRGLPELTAARLLGQPLLNYMDHSARVAWGAICATILAGGRFEDGSVVYHEQIELNWADGRQLFYLTVGALQDQAGNITGIIFTNQDLTAQKDAEQAALQRTRELSALYAVSTAVSQSLDLTTALDHALPVITDISGADGVQAFILDQGLWHLVAHQGGGLSLEAVDGDWLPATVTEALAQGEPLVISNVSQMEAEARAAFEKWGMPAQALIPLHAHGDTAGLLRLGWQRVTLPSERDVALWLAIGRQIDVAMVNARLYAASEAREREARALYTVARQLTTLDISRLPESILPQLHDLVDYDIAGMLTSREAAGIQLHVASPLGETIARQFEQRLVEECCSLDLCNLDSSVPVQITWGVPPAAEASNETIKSFLVAPLSIGARMLGVIMLGSRRGEFYQEAHQRTLLTLSNQIAIAVENAWLYQTLRERAQVLERAYADLQEADRLKDELVQNVSHELRTPLTFIRGYVQLLLAGDLGELTPKQHESLDIVAHKTDMLTRLVGDIVTLERTKRVGVRAQPMSLAELANLALDTCAATAVSLQVTLKRDLSPTLPLVLGDRDRISEVFDNLLSNALKFTPPGGVVVIRAREEADFVRVEVSDTGAGIPPDKLDKIFERFYQVNGSARRRFGGTGLGLAIVKQIIESHGGKIGVTSQLEVGTTFYFTLPQVSAAQSVVE